mmetsp:Transcript_19921/g.25664  ORF Transcript_19921/g.25664 Transcript_19921/m.25664 type:complete len:126 (+) Transcript_19921:169-546(+)|eukprot:CAMPEP_0198152364 /NCGR_PEP_ID=MMETSP1443-20131203/59547_1 /TAXON_ID=186043 /ORGANISM="Entomoneis sp., Strain CCMP2396" /LENGTH=125 /DNA_ID=CAMNT_0043818365 /DNA_START=94 /DNA_END=471 /DNA_ORIENTATION=+
MVFLCGGCDCEDQMTLSFDSNDSFKSPSDLEKDGFDLLVSVPEGCRAGNLINVKSPFGTRRVQMIIPPGLESGDKFQVTIPHPSKKIMAAESPDFTTAVENMFTHTPTLTGEAVGLHEYPHFNGM